MDNCEKWVLRLIFTTLAIIIIFFMSVAGAVFMNNYVNCRKDGCSKLHCYANMYNEDGHCFDEYKESK